MTRPTATVDDLESEEPKVRLRGLSALVETPELRGLLKKLFEVARRDPDQEVKDAAMSLYGKVRDLMDGSRVMGASLETPGGELDEPLVWRLLEQGRPDVKIDTLRVLASRRLTNAAPLLRRRLNQEDDPWVLATLVKALGSLGGEEDVEILRPHLSNVDPRVRSNTAEGLGMLGTPAALAAVRPHLASSDPRMRGVAALVMVAEDPEAALDVLQAMALDPDGAQREAALYRLGKLRHGAARVILARMVAREADPGRRDRALSLLEVRRAAGALEWLRRESEKPEHQADLLSRVRRVCEELGLDDEALAEATTRFHKDAESSGLAEIASLDLEDPDEGDVMSRSAVFWGREGGALGELARKARENARARKQSQLEAATRSERRRLAVSVGAVAACSFGLWAFFGPGTPPPLRPVKRTVARARPRVAPVAVPPEVAREELEKVVLQARVRPTSRFTFEDRWTALRTWLSSRSGSEAPPFTTRQLFELRKRHLRGDQEAAGQLQTWLEKVGDGVLASAPAGPEARPESAPTAP